MEISVTGHHFNITEAVRNHVLKRLQKVENHFKQPASVDVVLHKERDSFHSEATIHGRKMSIHASSSATDIRTAIDSMSNKLDRQVVKYKERLTSRSK